MSKIRHLILVALMTLAAANVAAKDYQMTLFGIKSDGTTMNTRSIQKAIDYIALDDEVGALVVGLGPEGRVLQRNVLDGDIVALTEIDELWAVGHAAQLERVVDDAVARLSQEVVGERSALSLDYSLAGDGYVVLSLGMDECAAGAALMVVDRGGGHEHGSFVYHEGDARFKFYAACEVAAYVEDEASAALSRDIVYGMLYGSGVVGHSVALHAEGYSLIVFGHGRDGSQGQQGGAEQSLYLVHNSYGLGVTCCV